MSVQTAQEAVPVRPEQREHRGGGVASQYGPPAAHRIDVNSQQWRRYSPPAATAGWRRTLNNHRRRPIHGG